MFAYGFLADVFDSKVPRIPTAYINDSDTPVNGEKLLKLIHLAIQNWKAITHDDAT